jgi:hypothetical protein
MKLPGAAFHDQDREASKLIQRQPPMCQDTKYLEVWLGRRIE